LRKTFSGFHTSSTHLDFGVDGWKAPQYTFVQATSKVVHCMINASVVKAMRVDTNLIIGIAYNALPVTTLVKNTSSLA